MKGGPQKGRGIGVLGERKKENRFDEILEGKEKVCRVIRGIKGPDVRKKRSFTSDRCSTGKVEEASDVNH